ncbi:MAG: DUF192 domain-containing protein [Bacteroidetes bacterium]|nr:DUF192 domain-containing protein [Bacteroidota bacterium]
MSKSKNPPEQTKKSRLPSPLLIIGGTILVLAVIFLFLSDAILDNRDPAVTRSLSERTKQNDTEGDIFRQDAVLTFLGDDGKPLMTIDVEIAESEQARTQGLMGRDRMAEQQGMLFIFPDETFRSFWMANTPLPLDIIFANDAGTIVTIQRNTVPYSEESIPSTAPARYVIEVNAGFCDRHGIHEGLTAQWNRKENT